MVKKLTAIFLACLFLGGSTILPLGDFSLMRDIPRMYHNYKKIATGKDAGIIDFIGDYLLHGKEILGDNAHDKPQTAANSVQFQHSANPLTVIVSRTLFTAGIIPRLMQKQPVYFKTANPSDFQNSLFRPPLA